MSESQAPFRDRAHAGRELADRLVGLGLASPVVLGLARGGVPVAAGVAAAFRAPLEVLVARKIGFPGQPEFGVGAVAEGGEPVLDDGVLSRFGLSRADLAATVRQEQQEVLRRVTRYRGDRDLPDPAGRDVVLVDDGLATGVTARAALRSLRGGRPARLVLAVPVSPVSTVRLLGRDADEVVAVLQPEHLRSVGAWYELFDQTTDEQVLHLLAAGRQRSPG